MSDINQIELYTDGEQATAAVLNRPLTQLVNRMDSINIDTKAKIEKNTNETVFAQHGLVPNDGVNEIRPQDMFTEVDVADVLVDKKGYPVRFSDGVYDRLGEELVANGDFSDEVIATTGVTSNGWKNYGSGGTLITYNSRIILSSPAGLQQSISIEIGKTYTITFDSFGDSFTWYIGTQSQQEDIYREDNVVGSITYTFTSSSDLLYFQAFNNSNYTTYISNISVRELPQFQLPKAPFASGSTDELLDDKVNGLTTQTNHSKGDIVVTGNELVENGEFDSDPTVEWTEVTHSMDIDNGKLHIYNTSSSGGWVKQQITTTNGAKYTLTGSVECNNNTYQYGVQIRKVSNDAVVKEQIFTDNGVKNLSFTFTATNEDMYVALMVNPANEVQVDAYFDNISVKLKDQSYIALEDTDAGDSLASNKFKPIPYVTKQVALLIKKDASNAISNIALPLVNMYSE